MKVVLRAGWGFNLYTHKGCLFIEYNRTNYWVMVRKFINNSLGGDIEFHAKW